MPKKVLILLSVGIGIAVLLVGTIVTALFITAVQNSVPSEAERQAELERTRQIAQDAQKILDEYEAKNPKPELSEFAKASSPEEIFKAITKKYGFNRFVDTWGPGLSLFIPEEAWASLSISQRMTMIEYARTKNYRSIITGRIKSTNLMYVDRTVWER